MQQFIMKNMSGDQSSLESLVGERGNGGDPDEILRTLASPRCRHLLALLHARGGPMSLEDAAIDIAAREFGTDPVEISPETANHMLVSLYHLKAPKLADTGLVHFDPDELTVTITGLGAQLEGMPFLPGVE